MKPRRVGALLLACSACSSSILVPRDDVTFARAQERLRRTAADVEKLEVAPEERWLFLAGETFYRYRFEPPSRGALTYVAQAAAVATEFPALQALAGSLDLVDLRLRSADGAVHLWETMLERHPQTLLRPLVLYRLGWGYRTTGAAGFPRSSDEAFDLLVRERPDDPMSALAREAKRVAWKSKDTAAAWSLIPGGGQMYVGEYGNGAVRLAVGLAAAALVVVPAVVAYNRRDDLTWSHDWPLLATSLGGLILLSINYTVAYGDAMRGVVQFNERAERAFEDRHPEAP